MKVKAKKSWLAVGAGMLAGAFALTGVALLNSEPKTALADEPATGKMLYCVDAGYYVANQDGTGAVQTRSSTPGYPATTVTPLMKAYGLSYSGLYNSVTDKPYVYTNESSLWSGVDSGSSADPVTGKSWGYEYVKKDGTPNTGVGHDTWRTWEYGVVDIENDPPLVYQNMNEPGFQTIRYTEGNRADNWEGAIVYTFEVDDATTALRLQFGTAGAAKNWGEQKFHVTVNGSRSDTQYSAYQRNTHEYTYDGEFTGVEKDGKYYVTVSFGDEAEQPFISYVMLTTANYEHRPLYTVEQAAKKGVSEFAVYSNDGKAATATLDAANQAIINEATEFSSVKVTATIGGELYENVRVKVLPDHNYYFVNLGQETVAEGAPFLADAAYSAETGYGYTTGTANSGKNFPGSGQYTGGDFNKSVRVDITSINYQFDNLGEGTYKVALGVSEYWSQWQKGNRKHDMKVNDGTEVSVNAPKTEEVTSGVWCGVNVLTATGVVGEDGKLTASIKCDSDELVIAWIVVYSEGHVFTKIDQKTATCTEAGYNKDVYYCAGCDTYYEDNEGNTEVDINTVIVPATNHPNKVHHAATATCTEAGTIEYWSCADCDKNYSDEACTQVVENVNATEPLGHQKVHHDAVAATCETAGTIEYWECTRCNKLFNKEACADGDVITSTAGAAALGHDYDYEHGVWAWDGYTSATLTATCKNDSTHTDVKTAVITNEVTTEATETEDGVRTYTATITVGDNTYTDTKTEVIPKTGTGSGEEPPQETPKKKGCKSSISASLAIVGGMLAAGTAAIAIKKRKNDK